MAGKEHALVTELMFVGRPILNVNPSLYIVIHGYNYSV